MIPSQKRVESPLSKVPPKKRYCPSGANRDTPVNEAKIILDNRRDYVHFKVFISDLILSPKDVKILL